MISKSSIHIAGCIGLLLSAAPVFSQNAADPGKSQVSISLLAIGDLPPIEYKATEKGPVFIEPPKEDFPPPLLFVKNKAKKEGFDTLTLGLNTPMAPIMHPGGKVLSIFEGKGDATAEESGSASKESYLNVPLPDEKVNLTVFLIRNPGAKSWRVTPKSYAFKNDLASFPENSVRVINFSKSAVKARIAGVAFDLDPAGGGSSVKIVPVANQNGVLEYQIVGGGQARPVLLANTAASFYVGSRLDMAIYDGDGKDADGGVKLCTFFEQPVQKEESKKDASAPAVGGTH